MANNEPKKLVGFILPKLNLAPRPSNPPSMNPIPLDTKIPTKSTIPSQPPTSMNLPGNL
jgi:hypothetical protein